MSVTSSAFALPLEMPPAYVAKQIHRVPETTCQDRMAFLVAAATGRTVLDIGARGALHTALVMVSAKVFGIDRRGGDGVVACDLDTASSLPPFFGVDLVICGETLEHLSNPGRFLALLKAQYPCRTILTVPNAHSDRGRKWLAHGIENVNIEHVAYYSYRTLRTLVERHGYTWVAWHWYHGDSAYADGLIAVVE